MEMLRLTLIFWIFTKNYPVWSQTLRTFPPLFNVAKEQPIRTVPAQSTCGIPTRNGYCRSSSQASSVRVCEQEFCVQQCPRRTTLPSYTHLLSASGFGVCVTQDGVNVRPGSNEGELSAVFNSGSRCFLTPVSSPVLGANGAFTLTFWSWQEAVDIGTIIEKVSTDRTLIFSVRCSNEGLRIVYKSQFGERELEFPDSLPHQAWNFVAVQVYDLSISVFFNGTGRGFESSGTHGLVGQLADEEGTLTLGQNIQGTDQFIGRLQDMRFYTEALTNREIDEVYTGTLPEVRISSACRCPPSHPRVKPLDTRFCIRNGVPDNLGDEINRLGNDSHPLEYVNDGDSNSVWISSFLNDVTLEVDLQDQFQVFYVVLQFYSPQPRMVTIEHRPSDGNQWELWQQYAYDCEEAFDTANNGPLISADSANCLQFETNGLLVPYSKGNITFNILSPEPVARPGHNDFYNTPSLIDFVKASQIRVRLQDHYYVDHVQHQYYGIYEYIVTGRCNCHGHASECDSTTRPYTCMCEPDSNTIGLQCNECAPLYNDKPFRLGDQINAYNCKPCQCYNHADSCFYNETADPFPADHDRGGGGTCNDCQHNTQGRLCDQCRNYFFREEGKSLYAEDVCLPCDCFIPGINGTDPYCEKVGGQCSCKANVGSRQCDQCQAGYFNLQLSDPHGCESCDCFTAGTENAGIECHATLGQCNCKRNVRGLQCDSCQFGFYNLTTSNADGCLACQCNPFGSNDQFCNPQTGQCVCKEHVEGRQCDRCQLGYHDFEQGCVACGCDPRGTELGTPCDIGTGQCSCKAHATGLKCDQCQDGYYNLGGDPQNGCLFCGCDDAGTMEGSQLCDKFTGECKCKQNVGERTCNQCVHNTYNLTADNPQGCEPCNCDPSGTLSGDQLPVAELACDHNTGQCTCLADRYGDKCQYCISGTYINPLAGGGCLDCDCDQIGTIRGTACDPISGQCQCYGSGTGITGRRCDECENFFFNLHQGALGARCDPCDCDESGSVNATCSPGNGQCQCKEFTTGRQCGVCVEGSSGLTADNPFGCSTAPSQQPPPDYTPLDPYTLFLYWDVPDYPNGIIKAYYVYRDGERVGEVREPQRESDRVFNDTGLSPFTEYQYQIEAENDFGSTRSPIVTYRTPPGVPTGDVLLSVGTVTPRTASFSWQQPTSANGIILRYILTSTNHRSDIEEQHYEGLAVQVTVFELTPFTEYKFVLEVCTAGGCLSSDPVPVITREAGPEGQSPPDIETLSSTQLLVSWQPPEYPNGVIIFYELWIRGMPGSGENGVSRDPQEQRIFHPAGQYNPLPNSPPTELPPPATNITVDGLDSYTEYEFRVISENSLGKAASSWAVGRTAEAVPEEVPLTSVVALSSTSLNITWSEPSEKQARGQVTSYNVYHYAEVDLTQNPFAPPYMWSLAGTTASEGHFVLTDLHPFTNQTVRLEMCNSVGCLNSTDVSERTLVAAPEEVAPPTVTGFNDTTMLITWNSPGQPNGPQTTYTVRRTKGAFNNPPPLVSRGTRFNGQGYYKFESDTMPQGVAFTGIDLWFKTSQKEGLLVFAASEGGQEEIIALQLRSGRPWFLFDPQACATALTVTSPEEEGNRTFADGEWHHLVATRHTTHACITLDGIYTGCSIIVTTTDDEGLPYNDNRWHHIHATRIGQFGSIVMDDRWTGDKTTDCGTGNIIGDNTGVYVGGLPKGYNIQRTDTDPRAQVVTNDFQGCLRDVTILSSVSPQEVWVDLEWERALEREGALANWEGCPDDLEPAYHFLGTGHVIFQSGIFNGGPNIDFSFNMRTELDTGLLFFAHGGTDVFWLIQLVDGGVYAEFSVSDYSQSVLLPSDAGVNICDGQWHTIRILKQGGKITITVDRVFARSNGELVTDLSGNINAQILIASHLYIGGVQESGDVNRFIQGHGIKPRLQDSFGGCIKSIRVNRRPYNVEENTLDIVNVNMDGCPATMTSREACKPTLTEIIYQGTGNLTYDHNNLPFTEYLYQVEATNEAGSTLSTWATGRTREGAPWGVYGPVSVQVLNGFTIHVTWREPEGRTGILSSYVIRAYNRDVPDVIPVEAQFNSSVFSGNFTDLRAFTNYSVYVVACTNGGCTQSDNHTDIFTVEEAPLDVEPPRAVETTAHYLVLEWAEPIHPNGILTGYALYMEDQLIYSGNEKIFNVTDLHVYSTYRFYVKACSRVGCTNSSVAHLSTAQLPPTHVETPQLTVLGTNRIFVEWSHPDELNGALEHYLIYVSMDIEELGEVLYNNSDLFTSYTLTNLTAGVRHYVVIGACTGGGCTMSNASSARTEESAPAGVRQPDVNSPTPSQLHVTWQPPLHPNGIITIYRLYHNGLMIYSSNDTLEFTINSLLPWTRHILRLEACTAQGCSSSDNMHVRTMEAPPQGSIGLDVRIEGPRLIAVQWNEVEQANGLVYYDVFVEGLYYVDPENWDYSTVTDRRSLYSSANLTDAWSVIEGLIPHSTYYVQVNASNSQGYILSNIKQAVMPMGSPDGVRAPLLSSPDSRSVRAVWQDVGRANADQQPAFQLQFLTQSTQSPVENLFEQPTSATTFLKTGLAPFTEYQFRLVAINSYGETNSQWTSITTLQDRPTSIDPPIISNIGTREHDIFWTPPYEPNGVVLRYVLYQNNTLQMELTSNITRARIDGLIPYTVYVYSIEACTIVGCTISDPSTPVLTLPALPENIPVPILISETPTSVLITWEEPEYPNGVILQYLIERRLKDYEAITLVQTFSADDANIFVDEDASLTPFTHYEYRIGAQSEQGIGYSSWAVIRTKSSRPGGVQPPAVEPLSSTSLLVTWEPPIQPNGRLESYVLKLPNPRFEIYNTSITEMLVEYLVPHTEYRVTITACTDGGCSESTPTVVMTSPALPAGVASPIATTHSQTYISVLWQPPLQPNGPNIRYELARTKIRQPLIVDADGFGVWTSIYSGQSTYYEDRGLTLFTTYRYRVTVFNNFGHTNSEPSEEVTTFGGVPRKAPVLSAFSVNHTAIEVRWQTPNVFELQGGVSEFVLNVSANNIALVTNLPEDAIDHVISDLDPDTRYMAVLTLVTHGGKTISSEPVYATTTDGAPEGLDAPQIFVINQTALNIAWLPPREPNGQIVGYFIYLDGRRIDTGRFEAGSFVLANLEPYTIYSIQIEVCTEFACLMSEAVQTSTAESVAEGLASPRAEVLSAYAIEITWQPPAQPNGIILRYELHKRTLAPCIDPGPATPEDGQCLYFECGILESFCGDQCYSGAKTCCDGMLYDNKNGYECCGTAYIPRRTNPTQEVCCGGHFYFHLENHLCCGDRYVEVQPDEICCADPDENRVDIGHGDACCGSVPYASNGSQICCQESLVEKYQQQCCGGVVVSDREVCCGDAEKGLSYPSDVSKYCCGEAYVTSASTVCCADDNGRSMAHDYGSTEALTNANERCCATQRISATLSCCSGTGYNPLLQACADVSDLSDGCGSGVVCDLASDGYNEAYCNRCNFDRTTHKCGSHVPDLDTQDPILIGEEDTDVLQPGAMCLTEPLKIYTGDDFTFTDDELEPFTEYQYLVLAANGAGTTQSEYTVVTTNQALPEGVHPPVARIEEGQLDTIYLSWAEPDQPNGEILWYVLIRDGLEMFRDPTALSRIDNNVIQPYRTYTYQLRVCNSEGCVSSEEVRVATLQARPEDVSPVTVEAMSPSALRITWSEPGQPNGFIVQYQLWEMNQGLLANLTGEQFEFMLSGLEPYGQYEFILTACTEAGCTNSSEVRMRTMQDRPLGVQPPSLIVVNATMLDVMWVYPEQPNGVLVSNVLFRSQDFRDYQVVYDGDSDNIYYRDSDLESGVYYQYILQVSSQAGATNSSVSSVQMPTVTPLGIQAPYNVTALSAYHIYVAWDPPEQINGQIDQYVILVNGGQESESELGVGSALSQTVYGLQPFTFYEFRIQACLADVQNGCGTGPGVSARTFEAAPINQPGPSVTATSATSVEIRWDPPESPNGVITQYRLYRRLSAEDGAGIIINSLQPNVRSFVNAGSDLMPYTKYDYRVIAVNSQGEAASPFVSVRTLEAPPQNLNSPVIELVGAHSFVLSWGPPELTHGVITHYDIEYQRVSADPTSPLVTKTITVPADTTRSSISGLHPYESYNIRIRASNSAGNVASQWVRTTTAQTAPEEMTSFEIEKMTNGLSVILRWREPRVPNGIISNYRIYEEGNVNAIYQGLNREFEFRRLQPYTMYTVQLEACTSGGCTLSPMQQFYTAEIPPQNQPAPTVSVLSNNEIRIQWQPPLEAHGRLLFYEILRRSEPRRAKRELSEPIVVFRTEDTSLSSYDYTDDDLEPFTAYEYQIRTGNSMGVISSPWQRIETSQGIPAGLQPPLVTHDGNHYDRLIIRWQEPPEANGVIQSYQLHRNDSVPLSFGPTDEKLYIDSGLIAYTVYSYRVTACTAGGCVTSDRTHMRTQEAPPYTVSPPIIEVINSTVLRISWSAPQVINGQIRNYNLKMDGEIIYSGQSLVHSVNGLTPYQAYTFMISACTLGGCTDSSSTIGRPDEDFPRELSAPILLVTGSRSIEVSWSAPEQPNGIITSYELERDGALIQTTQSRFYIDYDVEPGQVYVYQVTAFNSKGSITSAAASARTFASAPVGLEPPVLEALSANSIQALWTAPARTNGDIYNYTLYQNNEVIFSANQYDFVSENLEPYTDYAFRVEACTSHGCTRSDIAFERTMEAPPIDLDKPRLTALADSSGAHRGVLIESSAPLEPNGVITKYELYRRDSTGLAEDIYVGDKKLLYSGLERQFNDLDPELLPYTAYEYMVMSYNREGHVTSLWEHVRTLEAPPEGVPAPIVQTDAITSTTIPVEIDVPLIPNGVVVRYNLYLDGSVVMQGSRTFVVLGDPSRGFEPLATDTTYTIQVEACTGGGCTRGPEVSVSTLPDVPRGLSAPVVQEIGINSMRVTWQPPTQPNGPDLTYELHMRRGCPFPYADEDDEIDIECSVESWTSVVPRSSATYEVQLQDLVPYMKYELRLRVWNSGVLEYAESTASATTQPTAPAYIEEFPPSIVPSGNVLIIDWTSSFRVNGEVDEFILKVDDVITYRGARTRHSFYRESIHTQYEFEASVVTEYGQAVSDIVVFDPTAIDGYVSTEQPSASKQKDSKEVYEEDWFIALILVLAIVILAILFVGLLCFFKCARRKGPFVRERQPLESATAPSSHKGSVPLGWCVDPYDGSIIATELPKGASAGPLTPPTLRSHLRQGYVNPALSSPLSLRSGGALSEAGMQRKWQEEQDLDSLLDGFMPNDSGLHSLAYGEEELDADSDRPVSVLKEHMVFPDTHL